MNDLQDVSRPGLMLSQIWPRSRETQGETARALETAIDDGRLSAFQSVEIPYSAERRRVCELIHAGAFPYTYCITRVLNENNLNLSSLDGNVRKKSCDMVLRCLDEAREAGADAVSIISGPRPPSETDRQTALQALTESLRTVIPAATASPEVTMLIEPLDVEADKRMTLGYTPEALQICATLAAEGLRLKLTLDTAHLILNGEDPTAALQSTMDFVHDFHYCNCVLDAEHPLYGDRHVRFGPPGVVDRETISGIMQAQHRMGYFHPTGRPVVMCEVLRRPEDDPIELMQYCIESMECAWRDVRQPGAAGGGAPTKATKAADTAEATETADVAEDA